MATSITIYATRNSQSVRSVTLWNGSRHPPQPQKYGNWGTPHSDHSSVHCPVQVGWTQTHIIKDLTGVEIEKCQRVKIQVEATVLSAMMHPCVERRKKREKKS